MANSAVERRLYSTPEVGSQRLEDVIGMSSVWLAWIHDIAALHAFRA